MRRFPHPTFLVVAVVAAAGCSDPEAFPDPTPRTARIVEGATIGSLGVPFDALVEDLVGPGDVEATSGRPPEIVAVPDGNELEVLFQDHSGAPRPRSFVVVAIDGIYCPGKLERHTFGLLGHRCLLGVEFGRN